jgi:hypothetical protein
MPLAASTLIASALAGSLTRLFTHPLDTLKARLMASTSSNLKDCVITTFKGEGIRGFYRGFLFTAISSVPASCLYFSSQEWSREHWFPSALHSGFFAEVLSCAVYVPIDVVKERMQAQLLDPITKEYGLKYNTGIGAVKNIYKHEGILGFYKGYFSTLASFGPFSGLYFFFYEEYRNWAVKYFDGGKNIPAYAFWGGAGFCGGVAAFLTSPLDLVKLRMQLDPSSKVFLSRGMVAGFNQIVKEEGLRGLFRGSSARVLYFAPSTACSMALFEVLKLWLY